MNPDDALPSYYEVPASPGGPILAQPGSLPTLTLNPPPPEPTTTTWTSHLNVFIDPSGSEGSFRALFVNASGSGSNKNLFRTTKWWASHLSMRFNAVVVEAMVNGIRQVKVVVNSCDFSFSGVPPELVATPGFRGFWNDLISCYFVWGTPFLNEFVECFTKPMDHYMDNRIHIPKHAFTKHVFLGTAPLTDSLVPLYQVSNVLPLTISVNADHTNMGTPLNSTTPNGQRVYGHLGIMNGSVVITFGMPVLQGSSSSNRQ
ncbi:hypothetical protein BJ742DRAFT_810096 [Cladochytrium replicatum]|nr:hypothetical protein BJ742DRAFT_810096 [Cladochytrium replicatum]